MVEKVAALNSLLQAFKLKAKCIRYEKHTHIAIYTLVLDFGAKLSSLERYSKELALALKGKSLPLFRTVLEDGVVLLEIAEDSPTKVIFKERLLSFTDRSRFSFYLGDKKDGTHLDVDMDKNPHLLIAGSTGLGKSNLLRVILANANKTKNLKVFLMDTKNIDFHDLITSDIIISSTFKSIMEDLEFLENEMEERYYHIKENNLSSTYFSTMSSKDYPSILVIIDEYADLILQDDHNQMSNKLVKLVQKCRAAGIYFVLATQRPSADVIVGTIKANFPARISFRTPSKTDSKIVLDEYGAEALGGNGDCLIKTNKYKCERFQVAYLPQN